MGSERGRPAERSVSLWGSAGLYVGATRHRNGDLVIDGRQLAPPVPGADEYEYAHTVAAADVPALVAALGGDADRDVLELLVARREEIVRTGEGRWLQQHGVTAEFWSRIG